MSRVRIENLTSATTLSETEATTVVAGASTSESATRDIHRSTATHMTRGTETTTAITRRTIDMATVASTHRGTE